MALKVDVSDIISDHIKTLIDANSSRPSFVDGALFIGAPLLIAVALVMAGVSISHEAANTTITALAIFAGLLFNLLLLAHSIIRRPADGGSGSATERRLLKEIYVNISFAILVALAAVLTLVVRMAWSHWIVDFVAFGLVVNFVLTLLMVLKRIHVMLKQEFE